MALYQKDKKLLAIVKLPTKLVPVVGYFAGKLVDIAVSAILRPGANELNMTPYQAASAVVVAAEGGNGWAKAVLHKGLNIDADLIGKERPLQLVCARSQNCTYRYVHQFR